MGRSQRHKILVQNYPSDAKITAEHVISPGYLRQPGPTYNVPMGPAGGPLQGSSLAGPAPATLPDPRELLGFLVLAGIATGGIGPVEPPEEPTLTGVSPNVAIIGGADVTMICDGSGFTEGSTITFNGGDEPTTFISDTQVSTIVKPSTATTAGSYPVTVKSGPFETAPVMFTFSDPAAPIDQGE
jgi:hypothetical protein